MIINKNSLNIILKIMYYIWIWIIIIIIITIIKVITNKKYIIRLHCMWQYELSLCSFSLKEIEQINDHVTKSSSSISGHK